MNVISNITTDYFILMGMDISTVTFAFCMLLDFASVCSILSFLLHKSVLYDESTICRYYLAIVFVL